MCSMTHVHVARYLRDRDAFLDTGHVLAASVYEHNSNRAVEDNSPFET